MLHRIAYAIIICGFLFWGCLSLGVDSFGPKFAGIGFIAVAVAMILYAIYEAMEQIVNRRNLDAQDVVTFNDVPYVRHREASVYYDRLDSDQIPYKSDFITTDGRLLRLPYVDACINALSAVDRHGLYMNLKQRYEGEA